MSNTIIATLVAQLRSEIEAGLVDQEWIENQPDPGKTLFAPLYLSETILRTKLRPLFKAISDDHNVDADVDTALHPSTTVCRILAILIYIDSNADTLRAFRTRFVSTSGSRCRDSDLPLSEPTAKSLFGDQRGHDFYLKQFIFCPVILEENKEVEIRDPWCRLPFQESKVLGRGSSGVVTEVVIPEGHFKSSNQGWGRNQKPQVFAWKEFSSRNPKEDYKKERQNLEIIKSSKFSHPNILLATGSLIRGNVYSLYFEPAKHDLDKHLRSPDTIIPRDVPSVHAFLHQFLGLIDGLRFLHDELVAVGTFESLRFFHLDLKPTNILVFTHPEEVWKIHDFGMSRVSKGHHHDDAGVLPRLLPRAATGSSSSAAPITRSGSFLAPETHAGKDGNTGKVKAKSDVWSLGCILSIVISFLDQGPRSIEVFEDERKKGADIITDHFFVQNRRGNHVLNPGVTQWFEVLVKRFRLSLEREPRILLAIRNIVNLLQFEILLIKPEPRANSQKMKVLFEKVLSQLNARPTLKTSETVAIKRPLIDKIQPLWSKENKAAKEPPKQYEISLPQGSRQSKFSHCGEYLGYLSPETISFYQTQRVLRTDDKKNARLSGAGRIPRLAQTSDDAKWVGFEVGSKYLVAFTDRDHFDCYVYPHSAVEQEASRRSEPTHMTDVFHFTITEERSKIYRMCLSPNNMYLVHILKGSDNMFCIYLSRTEDMISWIKKRVTNEGPAFTFRPSTSQSLSAASRTLSHGSKSTIEPFSLPWTHILLKPRHKHKVEISHVQALRFSADSELFTISSEPPDTNKCIFYAWATEKGRYVNSILLTRPGNIDTSQVWVTAFTPLMPSPSILAVTFQRVLSQRRFFDEPPSWSSAEMNIQLLDVLPLSETDDRCLFIGRETRRGGTIKALYVERHKLKSKMSKIEFQYIIDLGCEDWIPGRDSAATLDDGRLFMIARVDETGFVRTFIRPNAPISSR